MISWKYRIWEKKSNYRKAFKNLQDIKKKNKAILDMIKSISLKEELSKELNKYIKNELFKHGYVAFNVNI